MAQALWRYNRALRVETQATLALQRANSAANGDPFALDETGGDCAVAIGFADEAMGRKLERINRYVVAHERSYQRALRLLQQAQARRPIQAEPAVVAPLIEKPKVAAAGAASTAPAPEASIGFESKFVAPSHPQFPARC